jgi:hypothetical protein
MKWIVVLAALALVLGACGARPIAPEEETSARWTSGDDAALEATTEASDEGADE